MLKTAVVTLVLLFVWCASATAETAGVHFTYPYDSRQFEDASFDGESIIRRWRGAYNDAVVRAHLADLDLEAASISGDGLAILTLTCRSSFQFCAHQVSHDVLDPSKIGAPLDFSEMTIKCQTRQECDRFLASLRGERPAAGPNRVVEKKTSAEETILNGKGIPKKICFGSSQDLSGRPAQNLQADLDDFHRRTVAKLEENRVNNYGGGDERSTDRSGMSAEPIEAPAVENATVARFAELFGPVSENAQEVRHQIEEFAPKVFDEWRSGFETAESEKEEPVNWLSFVVKERITDWAQEQFTNAISRRLYGENLENLPKAFQKDISLLSKTFGKTIEPFSLNAGYEQVNAMGEVFDLWDEP